VVSDECVNLFEAIGIAGLEVSGLSVLLIFNSVCLYSIRCLLRCTLNNRPAVMESNFKCFIVVMYV